MSVTLATQEAKIRRIAVGGQPRQKVFENHSPISTNMGVVAHTYHLSFAGSLK
jgi:hypothetical protein